MPFLVSNLSRASLKSATENLIPVLPYSKPNKTGGVTKLSALQSSYWCQPVEACTVLSRRASGDGTGGRGSYKAPVKPASGGPLNSGPSGLLGKGGGYTRGREEAPYNQVLR